MKRFGCLLLCLMAATPVLADSSEPKADIAGAKDSQLVGRFAGSYIVSYSFKDFDEIKLPLAALKPSADKSKRDAKKARASRSKVAVPVSFTCCRRTSRRCRPCATTRTRLPARAGKPFLNAKTRSVAAMPGAAAKAVAATKAWR